MRDLLLRRAVRDLDLVVEGDGGAFGRRLAERLGACAVEHARFGTAALALPEGIGLDVASARAESYDHPGALPRVRPGSMDEDLARRDFTVNAMAIEVAPGPVRLLDPHAGREDLRRRVLRGLHPESPRDDPTRAFRAALYANRLGFRVERDTARRIREAGASGAFERVSGDRLRREIARLFSEAGRAGALAQMSRLGLPARLHPALPADARARLRLKRAERLAGEAPAGGTWLLYLLVWAADLTASQAGELAARLNLPRAARRALERWRKTRQSARDFGVSADERLAAAAVAPRGSTGGRAVEIRVRGRDLVAAGIPPGPAVGRALAATRLARGTGRIAREEELAFAVAAARGRSK